MESMLREMKVAPLELSVCPVLAVHCYRWYLPCLWSPAYTRVTVSPVTPAVSKFFFHWGLKQQRVSSEEVSLCTAVSCSCEYQQTWWRQGPGDSRPQALIGHMQKAKMKALSESTFPAGCSPGLQHLPAVLTLSLSLTALRRALLQSPERQKDSRPRAALAPALSEAARMGGSFCLPGGGGMEASRPHRCWLLLFWAQGGREHANQGVSAWQGRFLRSQWRTGLFLQVTWNQTVVATVTAVSPQHKFHHTVSVLLC